LACFRHTHIIIDFIAFIYLVIGKGGVENISASECIPKGLWYLLRTNIGAVVGLGDAIAYFVVFMLCRYTVSPFGELYFYHLAPLPNKLRDYLSSLDLENEADMMRFFGTSLEKALLCIAFLVGVGVLCTVASYLLTRKRES